MDPCQYQELISNKRKDDTEQDDNSNNSIQTMFIDDEELLLVIVISYSQPLQSKTYILNKDQWNHFQNIYRTINAMDQLQIYSSQWKCNDFSNYPYYSITFDHTNLDKTMILYIQ